MVARSMFDRHGLGSYHDPDGGEPPVPSPDLRRMADTLVAVRPYIVRTLDESREGEVRALLRGGAHDALARNMRTAPCRNCPRLSGSICPKLC